MEKFDSCTAKDTDGTALSLLRSYEPLSYSPYLTSSDPRLDFVKNNVVAPTYNTLLAQPYNALAKIPNAFLPDGLALPKVAVAQVRPAKFGSGEWLAQNTTAGLSAAMVFGLSARLTGAAFRRAGLPMNDAGALIISGSTLEGLRDKQSGESHWGNVVSGVAMFGTFEAGNHMAKRLTGWRLHAARFSIGAFGSLTHGLTAAAFSDKGLNSNHLLDQIGTGATMNVFLPWIMTGGKLKAETIRQEQQPNVSAEQRNLLASFDPKDPAIRTPEKMAAGEPPVETTVIRGFLTGKHSRRQFEDYADFLDRGQELVSARLNVYEAGGTKILVPTELPDYPRPSVSDLIQTLNKQVDPTLIKEIVVVDHPHSMEPWLVQQHGPAVKVTGEATSSGRVTLYRPTVEVLDAVMPHEWSHLLKIKQPELAKVFDQLDGVENFVNPTGSIAYNRTHEPWSLLGQTFLTQPTQSTLMVASMNPMRSAVFGRAMRLHLESIPLEKRTPLHDQHVDLAMLLEHTGATVGLSRLAPVAERPICRQWRTMFE